MVSEPIHGEEGGGARRFMKGRKAMSLYGLYWLLRCGQRGLWGDESIISRKRLLWGEVRGKKRKKGKKKKKKTGVQPQWTSVFLFRCFKQFGTNIH